MQVSLKFPDHRRWLEAIAHALNQNDNGKTSNVGDVTLTASATTTIVTDRRIGQDTGAYFTPTTASAAAETPWPYVSSRDIPNNTFTITHANLATADRTFKYALIG